MNQDKIKEIIVDLLIDVLGGILIAIGIYNFAVASNFPVAGISGIAIIFYHFWQIPIGTMTTILNIPIVLCTYKLLGKTFLLKSLKTMLISNFIIDYIAPLFPVYEGELMLSCICMGVFAGAGYALIYLRDTSTAGADFITMAFRKWKPYLSLGKIIIVSDFLIVILGGILLNGDINMIIYGLIGTYILSVVVDKVMFGADAGKLTLIVTEQGDAVAEKIDQLTRRGSTFLRGVGSYSKREKQVVMCACNKKQMHMVQKAVKEVDPNAFMVTMESSEVRGEGFKPH